MTSWRKAVEDYVDLRRSLGFKLLEAKVGLISFASFLKQRRAGHITIALAMEWAQQDKTARPAEWARRLTFVRCFARHWSAHDPQTEVPPSGLLPYRPGRAHPYLYSKDEVRKLLQAAQRLPSTHGLRGQTYYCLLGLLVVTGLRISEARNLQTEDVDLKEGVLTIRGAKFGKSRLVPIHASTCKVLSAYASRRERFLARRPTTFFVSGRGTRLDGADVRRTFYFLSRQIGLRGPTDSHGPRLHDFRHRFAVEALVQWYRSRSRRGAPLADLDDVSGACSRGRHLLVFIRLPRVDGAGRQAIRGLLGEAIMKSPATLAVLLENFFTQRLMNQRQASPHTISSYRDTFRLLLQFAQKRLHKSPARLAFQEIDAPMIAAFLDDLEKSRGITTRSRNLRLTAIRSFFHYAAYEEPSRAAQIQRVLAIPGKRHTRTLVHFLSRPEIDALLAAPEQKSWFGRRDHALLLVAVQTGLRLSELTGLQRRDVALGTGAHVRCVGKGRKERCTPLAKTTVAVLKAWLREPPKHGTEMLFPNARGGRLSPDAVADLLDKHVALACKSCPSLGKKHVTPHVLRHSMAMGLLQAGVDRAVIALWLGHESVETTQIYLEANLAMKEEILAKTTPPGGKPGRYRPGDELLAFLKNL